MRNIVFFSAFTILLLVSHTSCSRSVIPVNQLPADSTITDIELEGYVNRSHIAILNRKPTNSELVSHLSQLAVDRYNRDIRRTYIEGLQSTTDSKWVAWKYLSDRLIEGTDTSYFTQRTDQLDYLISTTSNPTYKIYLIEQRNRLSHAIRVANGWAAGDSAYTTMTMWMIQLPIYDEINMGTENFVVSTYNHFYHRYPSQNELLEASKMVDGAYGNLFGSNANSRLAFLKIFFEQDEYLQGLVISNTEMYLLRNPTPVESFEYTTKLKAEWDFLDLQNELLSSLEYVKG